MTPSFDPSWVALGAAGALVAACWHQVKNAITQVRSLVIVKAQMNTNTSQRVYRYLQHNWKSVQLNDRQYSSLMMKVGKHKAMRQVPFARPPQQNSIYYRKRQVVMLNTDTQSLMVLRGNVNTDKLIADAFVFSESLMEQKTADANRSRFAVYDIMGEEKTPMRMRGNRNQGVESDSSANAPTSLNSEEVDPYFDRAILYAAEIQQAQESDPLDALFYDDNILAAIQQAVMWRSLEKWYEERGIPWRRGMLLTGGPGTGKSRLCSAVAERLRIPLYRFYLNTLSDQEFVTQWGAINAPAVVCFEDFDNTFHGRININAHSTLTFDTVLNAISGVQNRSGIFLMVTTNHVEHLDPAMGVFSADANSTVSTRPGRLDVAIHMGMFSRANRERMAERTLCDWPDLIEKVMALEGEYSAAQFSEVCVIEALDRLTLIQQGLWEPQHTLAELKQLTEEFFEDDDRPKDTIRVEYNSAAYNRVSTKRVSGENHVH